MWELSRFSLNVASWNFWWPLMIQGAALGFVFVPLTTITNGPIPNERMGNATSLFNLMRNIGASIGIAMVETVQFRKQQTHINILGAHVYPRERRRAANVRRHEGTLHEPGIERRVGHPAGVLERCGEWCNGRPPCFPTTIRFCFSRSCSWRMIPFLFLLRKPKRQGRRDDALSVGRDGPDFIRLHQANFGGVASCRRTT